MRFFTIDIVIANLFVPSKTRRERWSVDAGPTLTFQCWDRLQTSESDVFRRQILKSKIYPRTKKVIYL